VCARVCVGVRARRACVRPALPVCCFSTDSSSFSYTDRAPPSPPPPPPLTLSSRPGRRRRVYQCPAVGHTRTLTHAQTPISSLRTARAAVPKPPATTSNDDAAAKPPWPASSAAKATRDLPRPPAPRPAGAHTLPSPSCRGPLLYYYYYYYYYIHVNGITYYNIIMVCT